MKKFLYLLLLIGVAGLNAAAQAGKISEAELATVRKDAADKLASRSYRVKTTSESFREEDGGAPFITNRSVMEITPDASHSISETTKLNARAMRNEIVTIGDRRFIKNNDAPWEQLPAIGDGEGFGGGQLVEAGTAQNVEYKYLGRRSIRNQTANVYETRRVTKINLKNKSYKTVFTEKLWLNSEGVYLRIEREETRDEKRMFQSVHDYEYDANIKIEAPIE